MTIQQKEDLAFLVNERHCESLAFYFIRDPHNFKERKKERKKEKKERKKETERN